MPRSVRLRFRALLLILIAFPALIALACNLPSAQRREVFTNPFTGEEEVDEYSLSDEALIPSAWNSPDPLR